MIYDYALVLEVESPAGWGHTSAGGGVSSWVHGVTLVLEVEFPAGWGHTSAGGGVSSWVGHCICYASQSTHNREIEEPPPPPHTHTHSHTLVDFSSFHICTHMHTHT